MMSAYTQGIWANPPAADEDLDHYELRIKQQPKEGRTLPRNQRLKGHTWPVDPPPVLELISTKEVQPTTVDGVRVDPLFYLHNPNWFCLADLIRTGPSDSPHKPKKDEEFGAGVNASWSSSLHKVKGDTGTEDKEEHGYFVFGDINVKVTGTYKLKFTLFELRRLNGHVYAAKVTDIVSNEFRVRSQKGENAASTEFSRFLSDAGVKVKLRAEATKRRAPKVDWSARQTDSLGREVHLAPLQSSFTQSQPQAEFRGRNNMGVNILDRVQMNHMPLASMSMGSVPVTSMADSANHMMDLGIHQFASPIQHRGSQGWLPSMLHGSNHHFNPYARVSEPTPFPVTMAPLHGHSQMPMLPPRPIMTSESSYGNGQSVWYPQQAQQQQQQYQQYNQQYQPQPPQPQPQQQLQHQLQQPQQQWYQQHPY